MNRMKSLLTLALVCISTDAALAAREELAKYFGEISKLDEQVGALMKMLKETQQTENTIVLFVSEQGSCFPYGGKWSVYDNGIRASAILRWPPSKPSSKKNSTPG